MSKSHQNQWCFAQVTTVFVALKPTTSQQHLGESCLTQQL